MSTHTSAQPKSTQLVDRATQDVTIVPAAKSSAIQCLDNTVQAAAAALAEAEESGSDIQRAVATSYGLNKILDAMTPELLCDLCRLQGTKLGFRTDRDSQGGYAPEQLKPVLAEAMMRGLQVVGNHLNVIAGNLYVTKEGFEHLLSHLPGLTDLRVQIGVPANTGSGALVPARAAWKMRGQAESVEWEGDYRIPIRVNKSMGIDAIMGKARSKVLRHIYVQITGSPLSSDTDAEDLVITTTTPTPDEGENDETE